MILQVRLVFQQFRTQLTCSFQSLPVLPFPNQFRVAAEQHIRNLPAVEFGRSCVLGRGEQPVLETVAQG